MRSLQGTMKQLMLGCMRFAESPEKPTTDFQCRIDGPTEAFTLDYCYKAAVALGAFDAPMDGRKRLERDEVSFEINENHLHLNGVNPF